MLVAAPSAFATSHGGEGIWGPTSDQTITYAMFILIGLFPLLIIVFSLIQGGSTIASTRAQDAAKRRGTRRNGRAAGNRPACLIRLASR